jgi:hypothetical protein
MKSAAMALTIDTLGLIWAALIVVYAAVAAAVVGVWWAVRKLRKSTKRANPG